MGSTSVMSVTLVVAMVVMVVEGTPLDTLQPVSYSGWKVLEVQLGAAAAASERVTAADSPGLDLTELDDSATVQVLTQNRRAGTAEVAVSPSALPGLIQHLSTHGAPYTTIIEDLGRRIKEVEPNLRAEADLRGGMTLDRYMNYNEIKTHVEGLQGQHPRQVKVEVAGRSVEGRPIHLVTITDDVANAHAARKPVIFIDGGIHAREWVSPAAVLGVVDNLLQTPSLTAGLEWRIIPLVNPDGYVASWEKDRLWRKNAAKASGSRCVGVDLNRNFGYEWGGEGSSGRACSTIYRGPNAFSEPEAVAVRDAVLRESARTKAYITFHSYGQMILHPWGYTSKVFPTNNNKLEAVGNQMAKAIKQTNGVSYRVGSAAGVLYAAAGGSDDWAAGVANIPLSYTIELRDKGSGGFILPRSQIKPTVDDAWLAMKILGEEVLGGQEGSSSGARPAAYPVRQAGVGQAEEAEVPEPAEVNQEELQAEQTPGKRNEGPTNTNQGLVHIIQRGESQDQDPVNRNEEQENLYPGQESVNQEPVNRNEEQGNLYPGQASVNPGQENANQEPINRNEGQESIIPGQESINHEKPSISQDPINRNEGQESILPGQESVDQAESSITQHPINRDQGQHTPNPGQDNGNQAPVIREPEPESLNPGTETGDPGADIGNQAPVIREPEPESLNPGTETGDPGADIGNQAPVIREPEPESLNPGTETRDPGADIGNQAPVIREPEPGNSNPGTETRDPGADIGNQAPVIREPEPGNSNPGTETRDPGADIGNQAPVIREPEPGNSNQGIETRNQRPISKNPIDGNLTQDSNETEEDSNESFEDLPSPSFYSSSSGIKTRSVLQSYASPLSSSIVRPEILRWRGEESSESESGSESDE
ncbi:uncharacterized protein LOC126995989 isoform X4 [Eriocheir sinensis]|uniref:uncharacterized protein LOC126995989 isoform X4 n=1 Tax=Eriocheir sinensis TaxID=95602 RepID=UPI0021C652E6|nr:uncharacterized protein LOC126995989 isoform X4 [Eriocheir sinensis]